MSLTLDLGLLAPPERRDLARTAAYPRLRFMGSKYRVVPYLAHLFSQIDFDTALDGFSGSGVVSYALKELGKEVTANDFLRFPATVAGSVIENSTETLTPEDVQRLRSDNADGRDFIQSTFRGLYFPEDDHAFLDSAWSNLETFPLPKQQLALSALCLAAARKQPRGVFTVTDLRYDDGRRNLHTPLRELFLEAVADYNRAVFDNGRQNRALCQDIFTLDAADYDLVYLDPPYVPPRDDNDYIKRYHFLEGLCVYWRGQRIMEGTTTKKLEKRFTPFAYQRTIREALRNLFHQFRGSVIVLSYSSNSVPGADELMELLRAEKQDVQVVSIPHWYSFGTHATAQRRNVQEYVFIAR